MSGITRLVLISLLSAGVALADKPPPPLPATVRTELPNLKIQGAGEMKFLGLSIYDGYYWSEKPGWSIDLPFALCLRYNRNIEGTSIADRSVSLITDLGDSTPEQRASWGEQMKRIFPNVREGDDLTGVNVPHVGVRYFHNGKPIGEIDDVAFAKAFFGMWLDPRTSRPEFRSKLLGSK